MSPLYHDVGISLEEKRVAWIRFAVLGVIAGWVFAWTFGPQPVLVADAKVVLPHVCWMLAVSGVWALVTTRLKSIPPWCDAAGTVANFLGCAVLTSEAFILLIAVNALLPFLVIAVGARYGRRWFYASLVGAFVILAWAAPSGYWISRPAYAVYAIVFTLGLPLMLAGIISRLRNVSVQALIARDAQSRFVSMVSHELRTPLNTVINAADLIDPEKLSGEQSALLRSVTTSARALLHRVNAVLDVAALNGRELHLEIEPFRLKDVVNVINDLCRGVAAEKRVALHLACESASVVVADMGRIEQVVTNLVLNAIKYTPPGGDVWLNCTEAAEADPGRLKVTFTVTDSGLGIPDSEKPKIFEPFYQGGGASAGANDGVGLGLFIVQSISDQMGGKIGVRDNDGGGSIFSWSFEVQRAGLEQIAARQLSTRALLDAHAARVARMNCLLADDNAPNRDTMRSILTRAGHAVRLAEDGPDVLRALAVAKPDVLLLDVQMPGMSGFEVLDRVSASDPELPVIMLSADWDPRVVERALKGGARSYITKPVAVRVLLEDLERIRNPRGTTHRDVLAETPLEQLRAISSPVHVAGFLTSVVNGIDEALASYVAGVEHEDTARTAAAAHALKNELSNLGLTDAARACDGLMTSSPAAIAIATTFADQAKKFATSQSEFRSSTR